MPGKEKKSTYQPNKDESKAIHAVEEFLDIGVFDEPFEGAFYLSAEMLEEFEMIKRKGKKVDKISIREEEIIALKWMLLANQIGFEIKFPTFQRKTREDRQKFERDVVTIRATLDETLHSVDPKYYHTPRHYAHALLLEHATGDPFTLPLSFLRHFLTVIHENGVRPFTPDEMDNVNVFVSLNEEFKAYPLLQDHYNRYSQNFAVPERLVSQA